MQELPPDWLVRGLEERDYGIDLTLELFKKDQPTGQIALIQVKGTTKSFEQQKKLSFPTRTVEYSLLFQQPFFVFYTSVTDKKTYFVWIQKYVQTVLNASQKSWRQQDSITIHFPEENLLSDQTGKIRGIMAAYSARTSGIEFLAAYEWFLMHWDDLYLNANTEMVEACLLDIERMSASEPFLDYYSDSSRNPEPPDLLSLRMNLRQYQSEVNDLRAGGHMPDDEAQSQRAESIYRYLEDCLLIIERLSFLKLAFLESSDLDQLFVENSHGTPY
jgi:hypothetical protein